MSADTASPARTALCVLGVDPGLTGALAFYFPDEPERVAVFDMPVVNGEVDAHGLERRVRQFGPAFAVVERQGPRPTDGCKQSFTIGGAYHAARTVLAMLKVPTHVIGSHDWKRHHGILSAADPKEASRGKALALFPQSAEHFGRKRDHNRADASLIARFGANTING